MSVTMPPTPYKTPMLNGDGFLTEPWSKWFRTMLQRSGGNIALSNTELETLANQNVSSLVSAVATLNSEVSSLQTNVNALLSAINDLKQGRDL